MKILYACAMFAFSACASQPSQPAGRQKPASEITIYQNNQQGLDSIISNRAMESFQGEYADAPENKAFAQSVSGAWNWKSNRTSIEHAKTSALVGCQRNNKKSEDLYPCEVIHVNDTWLK